MARQTFQREKILECLMGTKSHPTAEMVYAEVRKEIPTISLATVYRNLNSMAKDHKISRLEVGGEYHFDGRMCRHPHAVCTGCGKITDLPEDGIPKIAINAAKSGGFEPECVHITFYGKCRNCRKGGKNGKD